MRVNRKVNVSNTYLKLFLIGIAIPAIYYVAWFSFRWFGWHWDTSLNIPDNQIDPYALLVQLDFLNIGYCRNQ